jgi:hypothetical protein
MGRRTSLTKRLVVRPVTRAVKRRRAERKRREAAAAKLWSGDRKIPRAQGGGRIVAWDHFGISPEDRAKASKTLNAKAAAQRKPARTKPVKDPGPGFRTVVIEHGTNAGYHAHRSHNTPACPACLEAHAAYNRAHR